MSKFRNNPGKIWRGIPSHGVDAAVTLRNIGHSKTGMDELVGKGLARVEE